MTLQEHLKKNFHLAWPVMLSQAGQILVNIADNVMVGGLGSTWDEIQNPELGTTALGAVALGNSLFFILMVTCLGFTFGMSPLIAQADARGNTQRVVRVFTHGSLLNIGLTIFLMLVLFFVAPIMRSMGQPPEVVEQALPYLRIVTYSMLPLIIFQSLRQLSEGLSLTKTVAIATIIANLMNIVFNYMLIYGNWGMPRLEVEGAAYGTLLSRIIMIFSLLFAMWYNTKSRFYLLQVKLKKLHYFIIKKLIKLGAPSALQMFFEVSAFGLASFICGLAGKEQLAAHQIALNLASTTFMICTGLGVAATIRVGNQKGLKNYTELKGAGWSAIYMVVAFMFLCGLSFVTFRYELPKFYVDDNQVIQIAAGLMSVAALFQLSDGIQVVCMGVLRGMEDVNIPAFITFLAYFGLALPLGYYLTVKQEMGAFGMWIGLGLGLTFAAIFLLFRFYQLSRRFILQNHK